MGFQERWDWVFKVYPLIRLRRERDQKYADWLDRLIHEDPERYQAILNGSAEPEDYFDWGPVEEECLDLDDD